MKKLLIAAAVAALSVSVQTNSYAEAPANYQSSCFACHGTGAAGAPKTGDKETWAKRLEGGMDAMVAAVKQGKGAMPPMGLCQTCTDDDFKKLIEFMAK